MSFLRKLSTRHSAAAAAVSLTAIALTALLTGCPEETPPPTTTSLPTYTCENGTPIPGTPSPNLPNALGCQSCDPMYKLADGIGGIDVPCLPATPYVCQNGTPVDGDTISLDPTGCQACESEYEFQDSATGGPGVSCVAAVPYVCQNGTPIPTPAPAPNLIGCQACNFQYVFDAPTGGAGVSCVIPYMCRNGSPIPDPARRVGLQGCLTCDAGYTFSAPVPGPGITCVETTYTCENGIAIPGTAPNPGDTGCRACDRNFVPTSSRFGAGVSCVSDMDNDNVPDTADNCPNTPNPAQDITMGETVGHACNADIDDDDDGLIEIWTLAQLHNMRYNFRGTTYDDELADSGTGDIGITTGAPTSRTANCGGATNGVYLCGYELGQSLDFDLDGDGSTVNPDGTLDADDNAHPHFVVARGGWDPIGKTDPSGFPTILEGNEFTISNLAIIGTENRVGLFGSTRGARIRNVGIVDASVGYGGLDTNVHTGGLVGHALVTSISGSHVTGNVYSSSPSGFTGGLVGVCDDCSIIASYASAAINLSGQGGGGGLAGLLEGNNSSLITASYAAGDVVSVAGGTGGGLVGTVMPQRADVSIVASYATGDISISDGTISAPNRAGGLIGLMHPVSNFNATGAIISSYAVGNVSGGDGSTGNQLGSLIGIIGDVSASTITGSYGFGELTGTTTPGVSTRPSGVTAATALNAANTATCSNPAYTTETVCTAATLTVAAGSWDTTNSVCSAPVSGATAGIDYTTYATQSACTTPSPVKTAGLWSSADSTCSRPMSGATAGVTYSAFTTRASCTSTSQKLVETWSTWSNADDNTLNAWVFRFGQTPKLRYADYDGTGASTTDYCALFVPAVTCSPTGDRLFGQ